MPFCNADKFRNIATVTGVAEKLAFQVKDKFVLPDFTTYLGS